jgi:hypothetical protein
MDWKMNKERFNQIVDEVYNKYLTKYVGYDDIPSKELFLFEIKNNTEFSEKWELNIEERELSLEERSIIAKSNHYEVSQNIKMFVRVDEDHSLHKHLDDINIPTKLITLTYNNETIESYE